MATSNKTLWINYLRSIITVMVVAHHASLAYTTFARFDKEIYINSTNAIVDHKRWVGLDVFQNFNDVYFMSLMFLITFVATMLLSWLASALLRNIKVIRTYL